MFCWYNYFQCCIYDLEIYVFFKDVGLIVEFSAFELMMFFGALHHMPLKEIKAKIDHLVKLLEIPSVYQRIQTMR